MECTAETRADGFASEVHALRDANATSSDTAARPRPPWPSDCSTRRVGGIAGERMCPKAEIVHTPIDVYQGCQVACDRTVTGLSNAIICRCHGCCRGLTTPPVV